MAQQFQFNPVSGPLLKNWITASVLIQDTLAAGPGMVANTYADGTARPTLATGVWSDSCVLMQNGNVLIIPRQSSGTEAIWVYNPSTATLTEGPIVTANAYSGGIQLPDGTVLLIPFVSPTFGIYNPTSGTLTAGVAHGITLAGGQAFSGAALGLDGNVYLMGGTSVTSSFDNFYQYNPVAQTLTVVFTFAAGVLTGSQPFHGCFTLPSGNILLSNANSNNLFIWNPVALTMTEGPALAEGDKWSGTLLTDGRVFLCPTGTNIVRIYDPILNTVVEITNLDSFTTLVGTTFFCKAVLLQDGNVALIPRDHTNVLIVNPLTGNVVIGPELTLGTTADKCRTAVTLTSGVVLMIPGAGGTNLGLFTAYTGGAVYPLALLTSRFFTKF